MDTAGVRELAKHTWEFLKQPPSARHVTAVSNADIVDFSRANLLLSICGNLQSQKDLEQWLSRDENEVLREWAIDKMRVKQLESLLTILLRLSIARLN